MNVHQQIQSKQNDSQTILKYSGSWHAFMQTKKGRIQCCKGSVVRDWRKRRHSKLADDIVKLLEAQMPTCPFQNPECSLYKIGLDAGRACIPDCVRLEVCIVESHRKEGDNLLAVFNNICVGFCAEDVFDQCILAEEPCGMLDDDERIPARGG